MDDYRTSRLDRPILLCHDYCMKKFILDIVLQAVREVINEDVAKRLDRLEYRMDKLEERMDKRIGELEQRVDKRIGELEQCIGGFEQRVDKRIGGVEESIKTLTESVINIKGNLEGEARAFHIAGYLKNQTNFGG
jgi:tetrahydromethanopterin S-methyltransferase subunit G